MIRVLVVDDSAFARKVLREVLAQDPEIEVIGIARDGLEALEKLLSVPVDLLVVDVNMPQMDGFTFLESLRQQAGTVASIPALVIIAVILGLIGYRVLKRGIPPLPTETISGLKKDLNVIKGVGKRE